MTVTKVKRDAGNRPELRRNGFTFKQFFVAHDRCAMKVGTDGVLLGAWAPVGNVSRALDIGSGSGLIALMLAQRSHGLIAIDAVELEPDAASQARENAQSSPWADRISVFAQDISEFAQQHPQAYDLIVSNPPYFESAVACRDEARNTARYTQTLTHDTLLRCAQDLLADAGMFCVVLPYAIGENFESNAHASGWFTAIRVNIRDRDDKPLHRMLLALSRQKIEPEIQALSIRKSEGSYSEEFCKLIGDFYLFY
ncbi:tRNA(1)(Val) (adenine(37)-N(6))-methyltransferase TrmN [Edaphovirga cremea]|uniref:tRNA(1)(Val) (adenine(37)-N(6))-methyltransferase TrmN n=1 Tax=Edaphovirga cremea TaxID=2267246 RepID=UPI000DEFDE1C|nr:tRNA1(Val) (adenine(37)-N6)-methyltransferase [Edaphovirga cremea]